MVNKIIPDKSWTANKSIRDLLVEAKAFLINYCDHPVLEAEVLLSHTIGKNRTYLHTHPESEICTENIRSFNRLLSKRRTGRPIAYLTGRREFWSLELRVTTDTLIPRPETEILVELALKHILPDTPYVIADMGTGCGAIAIAIAKERPHCRIIASDNSVESLKIAEENATCHQLENIEFIHSDWFENLGNEKFHFILSNPPYIEPGDPHLNQGDLRFEPENALTSGAGGYQDIITLTREARQFLAGPAMLILEHGFDQANEVGKIFHDNGYRHISHHQDLSGQTRVTNGKYS